VGAGAAPIHVPARLMESGARARAGHRKYPSRKGIDGDPKSG
jgi:hypothetical protein